LINGVFFHTPPLLPLIIFDVFQLPPKPGKNTIGVFGDGLGEGEGVGVGDGLGSGDGLGDERGGQEERNGI